MNSYPHNKQDLKQVDYNVLIPGLSQYYEFIKSCIIFDSGEFSRRSEYICHTLDYLNYERGLVTVAISSTSATKNTLYMSYLPDTVRSVIYNMGIFHTYQKFIKLYEEALNLLYVDNKYCPVIEYMAISVRSLQLQLMIKLKQVLRCNIILDRSLLSSYLYSKTLTKDQNISDYAYVTNMEPIHSFFITSAKDIQVTKSVTSLKTYDRVKNINDQLYNKLYQLQCDVPNFKKLCKLKIIRESDDLTAEENLKKNLEYIKTILDDIL